MSANSLLAEKSPPWRAVANKAPTAAVSRGDGGPAIAAKMQGASNVAVDAAGNLYIADPGNQHIRKVTASTGIITTTRVRAGRKEAISAETGRPP